MYRGNKMKLKSAELETVCGITSKLPNNPYPEFAFAGKSNVGKSSLINTLLNRKALARVSSQPGKTQTINYYLVNKELYFVDLPGYGYAKVSQSEKKRWSGLIEGYLKSDRQIEIVFLLIDMRHAPSQDDIDMVNFLIDTEMPFVIILTKADKLNKTKRAEMMEDFTKTIPCFSDIHVIPFSSQTAEGVEEIRSIIEEIASETD